MPWTDPEAKRAYQNAWKKRKRRSSQGGEVREVQRRYRARKLGVEVKEVRHSWEFYQLLKQAHRCHWCGKQIGMQRVHIRGGDRVDFDADHIIPLEEGGEHSEDNMVLACMGCNQKRGGHQKLKPASADAEVM